MSFSARLFRIRDKPDFCNTEPAVLRESAGSPVCCVAVAVQVCVLSVVSFVRTCRFSVSAVVRERRWPAPECGPKTLRTAVAASPATHTGDRRRSIRPNEPARAGESWRSPSLRRVKAHAFGLFDRIRNGFKMSFCTAEGFFYSCSDACRSQLFCQFSKLCKSVEFRDGL